MSPYEFPCVHFKCKSSKLWHSTVYKIFTMGFWEVEITTKKVLFSQISEIQTYLQQVYFSKVSHQLFIHNKKILGLCPSFTGQSKY